MVKRDYYDVLGINKSANSDQIKSAYRKLAVKYHPDKNPGDKTAEDKFKEASEAYHVLSNPERKQSYDSFGHAAFENAGGGRIVNVASMAYRFVSEMNFDDLQSKANYKGLKVYGQSKLANILFTRSLASKVKENDITVNCLHPGYVDTGIGLNNKGFFVRLLMNMGRPFAKKTDKGAETSIYLCASPKLEQVTGEYFVDCEVEKLLGAAKSEEQAQKLWSISSELTGLDLN